MLYVIIFYVPFQLTRGAYQFEVAFDLQKLKVIIKL